MKPIIVLLWLLGSYLGYVIGGASIVMLYSITYLCITYLRLRRPKYIPSSGSHNLVRVIIPSFNDGHDLRASLDSVLWQSYKGKIQIILVDDGSTDGITNQIMQEYKEGNTNINIITSKENSGKKASALNKAIEQLKDDYGYIVIVDADTTLSYRAIENAVDYMQANRDMLGACGHVVVKQEDGFINWIQQGEGKAIYSLVREIEAYTGNAGVMAGAFSIFKANAFTKIPMKSNWLVEDICWTWLARSNGYKIGFIPSGYAYTKTPTSYKWLHKQRRRWARGRVEALIEVAHSPLKNAHSFSHSIVDILLQPFSIPLILYCAYNNPVATFCLVLVNMLMISCFTYSTNKEYSKGTRAIGSICNAVGLMLTNWLVSAAVFMGIVDGIFNRPKHWLTNTCKQGSQYED